MRMQRIYSAPPRAARARRNTSLLLGAAALLVLLGGGVFFLRQGLVPWALNPLPAVDLGQSDPWFIDWRLAALKYNPDLCRRVPIPPHIEAQPIADNPLHGGCGWVNPPRLSRAGGVRAGFDKLTCETAAALTLWLEHDVQEVAQDTLGQRVVGLRSFGAFSCRNIVGNPLLKGRRSEHALANALDVSGFALADGRNIWVRSQWRGEGAEARFLKAAHARACRYFRVVLGPEYNQAHHDHFHLDRGPCMRCA